MVTGRSLVAGVADSDPTTESLKRDADTMPDVALLGSLRRPTPATADRLQIRSTTVESRKR